MGSVKLCLMMAITIIVAFALAYVGVRTLVLGDGSETALAFAVLALVASLAIPVVVMVLIVLAYLLPRGGDRIRIGRSSAYSATAFGHPYFVAWIGAVWDGSDFYPSHLKIDSFCPRYFEKVTGLRLEPGGVVDAQISVYVLTGEKEVR